MKVAPGGDKELLWRFESECLRWITFCGRSLERSTSFFGGVGGGDAMACLSISGVVVRMTVLIDGATKLDGENGLAVGECGRGWAARSLAISVLGRRQFAKYSILGLRALCYDKMILELPPGLALKGSSHPTFNPIFEPVVDLPVLWCGRGSA